MGSFFSDLSDIKDLFTDPKNNWKQITLVIMPMLFLLFKNIFNPILATFIIVIITLFLINFYYYLMCKKNTDSQNNKYKLDLNTSFQKSLLICIPLFIYIFCAIIINFIPNKIVAIIYNLCSVMVGLLVVTLFNTYKSSVCVKE